jgi:leucyl/phenylalanyl-tRNA---protein transferase
MGQVFLLNESHDFPHADLASAEGLIAIGGDLSPERVLKAYSQGIFPWYAIGDPIMWWSPDPRMVLFPNQFLLSKSLRKLMNSNIFRFSFDQAFEAVLNSCANSVRKGQPDGTWITHDYKLAFMALHQSGLAHSVEVYQNEKLVGGLYGLSMGKVFFGESMFFIVPNASKAALTFLVDFLLQNEFDFIDVQQDTEHLRSLGAELVQRKEFLRLLNESLDYNSLIGAWGTGNELLKKIDFNHVSN